MKRFDSKGFMSYLPLIATGAVGLYLYNNFFKKSQAERDSDYILENSSTGDTNVKKKYIESVKDLEPLVTIQHRDYANAIYNCGVDQFTIKNGKEELYIQSIFKSSSATTLRLVIVAFGLAKRKAFNMDFLPDWDLFMSSPKQMDDFMKEHYPTDNFEKIYQPLLKKALALDKYAIINKYGS